MAERPNIMVVESRYYDDVADELVRGATEVLKSEGAQFERFAVPGAFELPAGIQMAVRSMDFFTGRRRFDGYVALGCVLRGETSHYDLVCTETARALQELAVRSTLALGFGLLTCENKDQAIKRARMDQGNKGGEAANACLRMIELKSKVRLFPR